MSVMKSPESNNCNITTDTINNTSSGSKGTLMDLFIDHQKQRYPFCIIWTPIPLLTYVI
jgi:hypothetical protein